MCRTCPRDDYFAVRCSPKQTLVVKRIKVLISGMARLDAVRLSGWAPRDPSTCHRQWRSWIRNLFSSASLFNLLFCSGSFTSFLFFLLFEQIVAGGSNENLSTTV